MGRDGLRRRPVSVSQAWAVGATGSSPDPFIERWNGTAWAQVAAPKPGSGGRLNGVAATSATDAWAIGVVGGTGQSLSCAGRSGARSPPRTSASSDFLFGIAAASATSAWAVGEAKNNQTLALHWGGKSWKVAKVPSPGSGDFLNGVTATSGSNAWAVGYTGSGQTLVIHWNGKSWQQVVAPARRVAGSCTASRWRRRIRPGRSATPETSRR